MPGKPCIDDIGVEMACNAFRDGRYLLSSSRKPMDVKEAEVSDTWPSRPIDPGVGAVDDVRMVCFIVDKPRFKLCRAK